MNPTYTAQADCIAEISAVAAYLKSVAPSRATKFALRHAADMLAFVARHTTAA